IVFGVLICGGVWALADRTVGDVRASLTPFFAGGALGLFQAMGYTFIALQGFDLIAAVAGEVKEPQRVLPKAMLLSLAVALGIYLPLLFIIATVGVAPGASIVPLSVDRPEVVVALAARNFLGELGYWLVLIAAVLAMLSALQANLLAASRVALAMARDRTLPAPIGEVHPKRSTPITAIWTSAITLIIILLVVPDVASAGAAASLIFLILFALTHWTSIFGQKATAGACAIPHAIFSSCSCGRWFVLCWVGAFSGCGGAGCWYNFCCVVGFGRVALLGIVGTTGAGC
ncbi:MAG: APC family permease, partial [Candidatus Latescibacteria bacterium]|nr:APC family permease [Candidatus Latescibacterota bacterium]